MTEAVLQALKALDEKVSGMDKKVDDLAIQSAVIVERVGNVKTALDQHVTADTVFHGVMESRVTSLEHFRTQWKTRLATWAVAGAAAVSLMVAFAKDAIAGIFHQG